MLTVVNKGAIMISKSTEEYLKTMYVLMKQKGIIRVTDIAEKMNCSKPSVTKQLNILKEKKYIEYETYGEIKLTEDGISLAARALADYDILYILLHDVIGIKESDAESEANKIRNVVSNKTLVKISEYINKEFGLEDISCNFDITNESCRMCALNRKNGDSDATKC